MKDTPCQKRSGLLIVNKPAGMTSRQAVDCVQQWFPGHKLGHAGTLDPLATGVLVVAVGSATRLVEYLQQMPKTYRTVARLGVVSDTDDADGRIVPVEHAPVPTRDQIAELLPRFVGEIEQIPPAYSAVNLDGTRAYEAARRGMPVALPPRKVTVHSLRLLDYEYPLLGLEIVCGKGTYIRSVVRDLGQHLGCGAIVQELERCRIGPFRLEDALPLTASDVEAEAALRPAVEALSELPRIHIGEADFARLCHGQAILLSVELPVVLAAGQECAVFGPKPPGVVVAEWQPEPSRLVPRKVFADLPYPTASDSPATS